MVLKAKYKVGGFVKNGSYAPRTGKRDRIGYSKHAHEGCCLIARYKRHSGKSKY